MIEVRVTLPYRWTITCSGFVRGQCRAHVRVRVAVVFPGFMQVPDGEGFPIEEIRTRYRAGPGEPNDKERRNTTFFRCVGDCFQDGRGAGVIGYATRLWRLTPDLPPRMVPPPRPVQGRLSVTLTPIGCNGEAWSTVLALDRRQRRAPRSIDVPASDYDGDGRRNGKLKNPWGRALPPPR